MIDGGDPLSIIEECRGHAERRRAFWVTHVLHLRPDHGRRDPPRGHGDPRPAAAGAHAPASQEQRRAPHSAKRQRRRRRGRARALAAPAPRGRRHRDHRAIGGSRRASWRPGLHVLPRDSAAAWSDAPPGSLPAERQDRQRPPRRTGRESWRPCCWTTTSQPLVPASGRRSSSRRSRSSSIPGASPSPRQNGSSGTWTSPPSLAGASWSPGIGDNVGGDLAGGPNPAHGAVAGLVGRRGATPSRGGFNHSRRPTDTSSTRRGLGKTPPPAFRSTAPSRWRGSA